MYGIKGNQFGHTVISIQCKVDHVLRFMEVDDEVQRDMVEKQVAGLSKYIQYGLDGNDIYFPPLIFSARGKGSFNTLTNEFSIPIQESMIILDGQHRIKAFQILKDRLQFSSDQEDKKKLEYIRNFPLTIQIFSNLTLEQEKQLFTDVNTKSAPVSTTLLIMYKENDLCGQLVKEIINNHPSISPDKFEVRSKTTKTKLMTASTLYNLILTLNDGILIRKGSLSKINNDNYLEYKKNITNFLTLLIKYGPDQLVDRERYFILNPYVLQGIARTVFLLKQENPKFSMEDLFQNTIHSYDWSHRNRDLRNLGIPYNPKTKKYRFHIGTRILTQISGDLISKYLQQKGVRTNG
ncbi:DGQHR domain-containing protein [Priestia flexa]|uniref:DNA sulfur modification protein DndB n=1 Tax=Priestia flexa TaxID=86664 RepID=UPI00203BF0CE|nr:DNA sulfur modification protein DndB [Priestia flexa]MCM3068518.1 DGQHR domain-containing protein [Priestia flexa]